MRWDRPAPDCPNLHAAQFEARLRCPFVGADLRTVQLLLGRRSLATTAHYLRIATNKVCATSSPFELLPRPAPTLPPPAKRNTSELAAMARSGPEVADIFRCYGEAYRVQHGGSLSTA
ncbi:hypothetical protein X759_27350 [Mesorhizobium sp. LSHC420B00]|nr:hypothetical protein X759_27350 [Mesorhizobium sp. LSHC420B00]